MVPVGQVSVANQTLESKHRIHQGVVGQSFFLSLIKGKNDLIGRTVSRWELLGKQACLFVPSGRADFCRHQESQQDT